MSACSFVNHIHDILKTDYLLSGQKNDLLLIPSSDYEAGCSFTKFSAGSVCCPTFEWEVDRLGIRIPPEEDWKCLGIGAFADGGICNSRSLLVNYCYSFNLYYGEIKREYLLAQKLFGYQMGLLNRGFGVGFEASKSERRIPHLSIILISCKKMNRFAFFPRSFCFM